MRPDSSPKCLGPDFSRPDFASACTQLEASCDRRLAVLCSLNVRICCDNLCSEPTHSTLQLRTPILCPRAGAVVAFRKVSSRRSASCSYHTSMHLYDGIASLLHALEYLHGHALCWAYKLLSANHRLKIMHVTQVTRQGGECQHGGGLAIHRHMHDLSTTQSKRQPGFWRKYYSMS